MNISVETENCSYENFFNIEESADSAVILKMHIPNIVSIQSRKILIREAKETVQQALSHFQWLIFGSVRVDLTWYLNAVERQETDKIGDLDNISKPLLDSLLGPDGILVDDSQIKALESMWISRNDLIDYNVVYLKIVFNNDYAMSKHNLYFVQYDGPICAPINIDILDKKSLLATKILFKTRSKQRMLARAGKKLGVNSKFLVLSEYDFHRTRLAPFGNQLLTMEKLNFYCKQAGIGIQDFLKFFRNSSKNI